MGILKGELSRQTLDRVVEELPREFVGASDRTLRGLVLNGL